MAEKLSVTVLVAGMVTEHFATPPATFTAVHPLTPVPAKATVPSTGVPGYEFPSVTAASSVTFAPTGMVPADVGVTVRVVVAVAFATVMVSVELTALV